MKFLICFDDSSLLRKCSWADMNCGGAEQGFRINQCQLVFDLANLGIKFSVLTLEVLSFFQKFSSLFSCCLFPN